MDGTSEDQGLIWWEWEVGPNIVSFSRRKVTTLGYDPAEFEGKGYQAFTDLVHPEDQEKCLDAMKSILYGRSTLYQVDYRIKTKADGYHLFMDRGTVISSDPTGKPESIRGIVIDLEHEAEVTGSYRMITEILGRALINFNATGHSALIQCSQCRKIRHADTGEWLRISEPVVALAADEVSHGLCPDCAADLYPDFYWKTTTKNSGQPGSGPSGAK